jgi:hypothetical protein
MARHVEPLAQNHRVDALIDVHAIRDKLTNALDQL